MNRKNVLIMKCILTTFICLMLITSVTGQKNWQKRMEGWQDARFGMFIHWGPISLKGAEISWSRGSKKYNITVEEYDSLYKQFNPVNFNADEWVRLAKEAGMKYIVFTAKHTDGFCMWDTRYIGYNIMHSPFGRDVVKELADACKKQGIALGIYYSTADWWHPDFPHSSRDNKREPSNLDRYTEYLKNQSAEIIQKYGPILLMWYDYPQDFDSIRGQRVIDHIRKVQPDILVNDRTGAKGDFDTAEQRVGNFQNDRPWETCMTIGRQWSWKPNDEVKSLEQCLQSLVRSAGGDGNLLLNVGPKSDGQIEPLQVERLKEMGAWLKKYGQTIYGTRGGPFKPTDWGVSTRKGSKIYVHILNWFGDSPRIVLPDTGLKIKKCQLLTGGKVKMSTQGANTIFEFDKKYLQKNNTILELEMSGNAINIQPMEVSSQSVSYLKKAIASNNPSPRWHDVSSVVNGDWVSHDWRAAKTDKTPWVEIDLGKREKISKAVLFESGRSVKAFELQYLINGEWKTLETGKTIGNRLELDFPEVEAQNVRLQIVDFEGTPAIYEIVLL